MTSIIGCITHPRAIYLLTDAALHVLHDCLHLRRMRFADVRALDGGTDLLLEAGGLIPLRG
jgi:hypothetical protein